jgi:hypothetical protein
LRRLYYTAPQAGNSRVQNQNAPIVRRTCRSDCAGILPLPLNIFQEIESALEQFTQAADLNLWDFFSEIPQRGAADTNLNLQAVYIFGGQGSTMRGEASDVRTGFRNALRDTVQAALARSNYLAGKNLRFEFHEDGVVLRGVVRSYYQKQLAQESLKSISGLCRIQNEIEVVSI